MIPSKYLEYMIINIGYINRLSEDEVCLTVFKYLSALPLYLIVSKHNLLFDSF